MLMNLLPGLRELRAPLAAGYLWIITAFLWLSEWGRLPTSRPAGDGWDAKELGFYLLVAP